MRSFLELKLWCSGRWQEKAERASLCIHKKTQPKTAVERELAESCPFLTAGSSAAMYWWGPGYFRTRIMPWKLANSSLDITGYEEGRLKMQESYGRFGTVQFLQSRRGTHRCKLRTTVAAKSKRGWDYWKNWNSSCLIDANWSTVYKCGLYTQAVDIVLEV